MIGRVSWLMIGLLVEERSFKMGSRVIDGT